MRAYYRTSYRTHSAHDSAESKARQADTDQATATAAAEKAGETGASVSTARSALRAAADDLGNAADALRAAAKALTDAGDTPNAGTVEGYANTADANEGTADGRADDSTVTDASNYVADLNTAAGHLGTAASNLREAATFIRAHETFQLRAEVKSGDGEYILVVDKDSEGPFTLDFHGVTSTASRKGRLANEGNAEFHVLTATAPGLLTVAATGSGDLKGELYTGGLPVAAEAVPIAEADGSGTQFTLATPVTLSAADTDTPYTLAARSQTRGTIEYSFDVTFAVAQSTTATLPNGTVAPAPTWTGTNISDDEGTMTKIAPRPNANERADQDVDVFVFTMAAADADPSGSGLLTVNGNDGSGGTHAKTTATLYGPRGAIATDSSSGPGGTHFGFDNIPVKGGERYAVKVTGTEGGYSLQFDHSPAVTIANNVGVRPTEDIDPTPPRSIQEEPRPLPV